MIRSNYTAVPAIALFVMPLATAAQTANPYDGNPAAIRAGSALFANECATCHNGDATGLNGPDLTQLFALGVPDASIFQTIREGVAGSVMPASEAPDQELWAMVAWLKSVSTVSPFENTRGDAVRGSAVFADSCARCHRVQGDGGTVGPDLTRITRVRTRDAIVSSIRDPAASVGRGYRVVTLVTAEGERVRGLTKGEDAFSIQVMDTRQRLQGYLKADLSELVREEASLMPTFGPERLDESDLDDLLRYLASLSAPGP